LWVFSPSFSRIFIVTRHALEFGLWAKKKKFFLSSYEKMVVVINWTWLPLPDKTTFIIKITSKTVKSRNTSPDDDFEDTKWLPGQFQTSTLTGCRIGARNDFTDQSIRKAHEMCLTLITARPCACFQLHPRLNCTAHLESNKTVQDCVKLNGKKTVTFFVSIVCGSNRVLHLGQRSSQTTQVLKRIFTM
jgi:hypothetical protein